MNCAISLVWFCAGIAGITFAEASKERGNNPAGNIILIGWDGAQRAHLRELLSSGQLPNLQQFIKEGSLVNTEVTTGTTHTKPGWAEILTGYSAIDLEIFNNAEYQPIPKGYTIFERLKEYFGVSAITTIFIGGKSNNIGSRGPHEICINCLTRDPVTHEKTMWWDRLLCDADTKNGQDKQWVPRMGEPYFYAVQTVDLHKTGLGPANNVLKEALAALDTYKDKVFFAFFHFEEPDEQGHLYGENSSEYSQGIKEADSCLGMIVKKLKRLGIYQKTTIYVTADHGMDEGKFSHKRAPYMFFATNSKKKLIDGDRKDITPTILEQYGMDPRSLNPKLDGKSLFMINENN